MSLQGKLGAVSVSKTGRLAFALAPPCDETVLSVEIDRLTGAMMVRFEGSREGTFWGTLGETCRLAAASASEILIAHFATLEDFAAYETSREYRAPLIS